MTLGVRVLAHDPAGRVLLVKHSYTPGWHLPGGGVDVGETARAAALRELREEAGAAIDGPLDLHGLFFNSAFGRRDHVACFRGRLSAWSGAPASDALASGTPWPNLEIVAADVFAPDDLPREATPATLRRIAEWHAGVPISDDW